MIEVTKERNRGIVRNYISIGDIFKRKKTLKKSFFNFRVSTAPFNLLSKFMSLNLVVKILLFDGRDSP